MGGRDLNAPSRFVAALRGSRPGVAAWTLLVSLLLVTGFVAMRYDRAGWEGPAEGESTMLMSASSLAHDFDRAYTRADFDRFVATWGYEPTDLALRSGSAGRRITFDAPLSYSALLAPFVRIWPRHGFAIANALLLVGIALLGVARLRPALGSWSPAAVAVLIFGSVVFGYVFLALPTLLWLGIALLAVSILERTGPAWQPFVAGALLAPLVTAEPVYLPVIVALLAGVDAARRRPAVVGLASAWALSRVLALIAGGGLGLDETTGLRFGRDTGFPLVDFPAEAWADTVRELGALSAGGGLGWGLDLALWLWNGLYLFWGEAIGLVPYFLPLLVLLLGWRRDRRTTILLVALFVWIVTLLLVRPFDLAGGADVLGNRVFVPMYGLSWALLGARRRALAGLAVVALVSPLTLGSLWQETGASPRTALGAPRFVTPFTKDLLPFETTQEARFGERPIEHNGLWVHPLGAHLWNEVGRERLVLESDEWGDLIVSSREKLDGLRFAFGADAPSRIEFAEASPGERHLTPSGGISFGVLVEGRVPHHPLWWTPRRMWVYRVRLRLPDEEPGRPLAFRVTGERRVRP